MTHVKVMHDVNGESKTTVTFLMEKFVQQEALKHLRGPLKSSRILVKCNAFWAKVVNSRIIFKYIISLTKS